MTQKGIKKSRKHQVKKLKTLREKEKEKEEKMCQRFRARNEHRKNERKIYVYEQTVTNMHELKKEDMNYKDE